MGCGTSMNKGTMEAMSSSPQAVAEAEEAAVTRLTQENLELRRQNATLTTQVQELQQRMTALTTDMTSLRTDMNVTHACATKAAQTAQTAVERAEAAEMAVAASLQARPPAAGGPIPMRSSSGDPGMAQRVQQLEAQLSTLTGAWDKLEGQKAKEEFAKQLAAAKGEGVVVPHGSGHHQHSSSNASSSAGPSGAPAARRPSAGSDSAMGAAGPAGEVIDGNGLLPSNNNFPTRFGGGGAAALRASRDRAAGGRPGGPSGDIDNSAHGPPAHAGMGGMAAPGGAVGGGDFMSTHRYGTVMPSDFKLAEQRKAGPRQGFM